MGMWIKATDFEILRGVEANGRIALGINRKPVRVATLLDEKEFLDGHFLVHNRTVFLEDRVHDWTWIDGKFRYYSRIAQRADVVVVYAEERVDPPARFDPMTGMALEESALQAASVEKGGSGAAKQEGEDGERNKDAG